MEKQPRPKKERRKTPPSWFLCGGFHSLICFFISNCEGFFSLLFSFLSSLCSLPLRSDCAPRPRRFHTCLVNSSLLAPSRLCVSPLSLCCVFPFPASPMCLASLFIGLFFLFLCLGSFFFFFFFLLGNLDFTPGKLYLSLVLNNTYIETFPEPVLRRVPARKRLLSSVSGKY